MTAVLIVAASAAAPSGWAPGPLQLALLQGSIAAAVGRRLGMAIWWMPIHLAFTPALVLALSFELHPLWFIGGFLLLALVYGKAYQTQVPLYLSSRMAIKTLASLLPERRGFLFVDLGSGCGGLLHRLAKERPDGNYHGIEAAPLPFVLSKCRNLFGATRCSVSWGNFWNHDLGAYDMVYAYLSPVPMAALWRKARREMRPGSIFVSNGFAVPGVTPDLSCELHDVTGSALYLWRM